jgi:hypothetical protein
MSADIYVINMNGVDAKTGEIDPDRAFTHIDRYDGDEYVFPPKERVLVPKAAATHMLGWNMPDKSEVLVRLGWAMTYDPAKKDFTENPDGVKKLARFVFDDAVMVAASSLRKAHDDPRSVHDARNV